MALYPKKRLLVPLEREKESRRNMLREADRTDGRPKGRPKYALVLGWA